MTALARIETAPFTEKTPDIARGPAGMKPQLRWIAIDCLRIDRAYQRTIMERGARNVIKIATEFNWSRFATVIVAEHSEGLYTIIDGQHRTTAAALRGIKDVPCQVVDADPAEQALAFAAINSVVTQMSPLQLHAARLAGGDPRAVMLDEVCRGAGVTILRYPMKSESLKVGETLAAGTLYNLLAKYGETTLRIALSCITRTRDGYPGFMRNQLIQALCVVLESEPAWRDAGPPLLKAVSRMNLAQEWRDAMSGAGGSRAGSVSALIERIGNHLEQTMGEAAA